MDQIILLEYVASIDNGSSREILSALATANNRWLACKVKLSLNFAGKLAVNNRDRLSVSQAVPAALSQVCWRHIFLFHLIILLEMN